MGKRDSRYFRYAFSYLCHHKCKVINIQRDYYCLSLMRDENTFSIPKVELNLVTELSKIRAFYESDNKCVWSVVRYMIAM